MTLYRRKLETVEAFHYEAALETMDFKYPFPDWLKDMVTVIDNAILQLDTDSGNQGSGLLEIAAEIYTYWTQKNFTEDMRLRVTSFCDCPLWRGCPPPMPFAISYSEVKPRLLFRPSPRRPRVLGQAAS